MTREEIIEELAMVLCHIDGMYWNDLTLTEASDYKRKTERVCLKVDRELPFDSFRDIKHNEETHGVDTKLCPRCQLLKLMLAYDEAGYEAVKPLIEGVNP